MVLRTRLLLVPSLYIISYFSIHLPSDLPAVPLQLKIIADVERKYMIG